MSTVNTSSFHSLAEEGNFNSNAAVSSNNANHSHSNLTSNSGRLPNGTSSLATIGGGDATNYYSVLTDRPSTTTDEDDSSELVVATSTPIRRRDIINATDAAAHDVMEDFNRSPIKSMTQL